MLWRLSLPSEEDGVADVGRQRRDRGSTDQKQLALRRATRDNAELSINIGWELAREGGGSPVQQARDKVQGQGWVDSKRAE